MNNIAKVLTILKYVTLSFDTEDEVITTKQIPGDETVSLVIAARAGGQSGGFQIYDLLYNWQTANNPIPLLVPNIDTTYFPDWCRIKVPTTTVLIIYSQSGTQTQTTTFKINSRNPLYIRGEATDGSIKRNVTIINSMTAAAENTYDLNLNFNINGISILPGTTKRYPVKISFYKNKMFTQYLGFININIDVFNSSGPGE